MEIVNRIKKLNGLFASTLSTLTRTGQIDHELLPYSTKAVELALTLLPNEEIAFQIVFEAVLGVEKVAYEQKRSRIYSKTNKRTKLVLGKSNLFQQIIYYESQKWEEYQEMQLLLQYLNSNNQKNGNNFQKYNAQIKELEQALKSSEIRYDNRLTELSERLGLLGFDKRVMIRRYLKFLIHYSMNNNSSYAALSISHLIYDYTLPQVNAICGLLNPNAMEGTYLYKLKQKLLSSIKQRFGNFINFNGQGSKEHFDIQLDPDGELAEFTKTSSYILTPWKGPCLVERFDAISSSFDQYLCDWLEDIEDENEKELCRAHIIICPNCYMRLTTEYMVNGRATGSARKLPVPKSALPHFKIPIKINDQLNNKGQPDNLLDSGEKEHVAVTNRVREMIERESIGAEPVMEAFQQILVFVNSKKKGELDLTGKNSLRLKLDQEAGFIKVMSHNNGKLVLLASLMLEANHQGEFITTLHNGKKIVFNVEPYKSDIEDGFIIEIDYCQHSKASIAAFFKNLPNRLWHLLNQDRLTVLSPTKALFFIAILISVLGLLYFQLTKNRFALNQQAQWPAQQQKYNEKILSKPSNSNNDQLPDGTVMGIGEDLVLSQIDHIYIDQFNNNSTIASFYLLMIASLKQQKLYIEDKEAANGFMKAVIKEEGGKQVIIIKLINERNQTLFQYQTNINKDLDLTELAKKITALLLQQKAEPLDHKQ